MYGERLTKWVLLMAEFFMTDHGFKDNTTFYSLKTFIIMCVVPDLNPTKRSYFYDYTLGLFHR